jgi:hypothetical protein
MRGVPSPSLEHLHGSRRTWREANGVAVGQAGAAADTAGTARGRSPGPRCAAARRAVGLAAEGRGEKLPPRNGETPG